jgi:hypothetical protein
MENKKILPRVKFTGQQPGEEGVEKDEKEATSEPAENASDETDERGLPAGEPSTEGKFSV